MKDVERDVEKAERRFDLVFIRGRDTGIEDEDEAAFIVRPPFPITKPFPRVVDVMVVVLTQNKRNRTIRMFHLDTSSWSTQSL